jgi:hypothetical protein
MWQTIEHVLSAIGAVVVGAGAVTAFSLWLFKLLASKWLDNQFARDLEEFRHQHQSELQRLKLEIDALLDRTIKLHGKEFEALPQAWSLLNDAYGAVAAMCSRIQSYANLENMTTDQLNEFLRKADLPEWKKDELRTSSEKNKIYSNAVKWTALCVTENARWASQSYVLKNGIFFPEEIRTQFMALDQLMYSACIERRISLENSDIRPLFTETDKVLKEGMVMLEKLQAAIRDRLWNSTQNRTSDGDDELSDL